MQAENSRLTFHEEVDTFSLTVIFQDDELTIRLEDFVDWALYERKYTEGDVGKEIDRKMDVIDVYKAFSQSKAECDEENIKQQETGVRTRKFRNYQFGSVVQDDGAPCYRIEKAGKVVVYYMLLERKGKKPVIFQSALTLNKVRDLSEKEIAKHQFQLEKRRILEETGQQVQKERKEKEQCLQKIRNMDEIISKLKEEGNQLKEKLRITKEQQKRSNQKIQNLTTDKQKTSKKIKELQTTLKPIKQIQQRLLSFEQTHLRSFRMDGFKVQYINTNLNWTQFIFNQPIKQSESIRFRLKIIQTKAKFIMVGVADYAKLKDRRTSSVSGSAMCYSGSDGNKFPGGGNEGDGFGQGDVVEVYVNRPTSTLRYSVNGILKATQTNEMLGKKERVFYPYFEMYHTNDIVQWLIS